MTDKLTINFTGTKRAIGRTGYQILCLFADHDLDDTMDWLVEEGNFHDTEDVEFHEIQTLQDFMNYFDSCDEEEIFFIAMEMCEVWDIFDTAHAEVLRK